MARTKKADADAVAVTDSGGTTTATEKKFPLERLAENSIRLFGVPSSTFMGATADLKDGNYSKTEIAEAIENWKRKAAK